MTSKRSRTDKWFLLKKVLDKEFLPTSLEQDCGILFSSEKLIPPIIHRLTTPTIITQIQQLFFPIFPNPKIRWILVIVVVNQWIIEGAEKFCSELLFLAILISFHFP